jgi:hypothetical protein
MIAGPAMTKATVASVKAVIFETFRIMVLRYVV